jgi:hypothetical protein
VPNAWWAHLVTSLQQQFGRFWGKAEMDRRATNAKTDVNDPTQSLGSDSVLSHGTSHSRMDVRCCDGAGACGVMLAVSSPRPGYRRQRQTPR